MALEFDIFERLSMALSVRPALELEVMRVGNRWRVTM
jgi:hypothetical protein